jgi:protein tyrosine phosphatase (PTP) superfamily phosphohydrolase (DUF442 family)
LRAIAAAGYQAIINLGLADPKYCLPDEATCAATLGMEYRHIPVHFDAPTIEDVWEFVDTMDELSRDRVFVHCASNYRVSCFIALYGQLRLGWTSDKADRCVREVWTPNHTWSAFVGAVRRRLRLSEKDGHMGTPTASGLDGVVVAETALSDVMSMSNAPSAVSSGRHGSILDRRRFRRCKQPGEPFSVRCKAARRGSGRPAREGYPMKFAKYVFIGAGVWGILVLTPLFFLVDITGRSYPPPTDYPHFFYGFLAVGMAWQIAFLVIGSNPARFRPLIIPGFIEKAGYIIATAVLHGQGRISAADAGTAIPDTLLLVLFVVAFVKTRPD